MEIIGAIDIGSNAIRFTIAKSDKRGNPEYICKDRFPLRLGADVFAHGAISKTSLSLLLTIFGQIQCEAREHKVKKIKCCATSAMRNASNGQVIANHIEEQFGVPIEIIDGDTEAKMIQAAVASRLSFGTDNFLLIDIGGGSVELSAIRKGVVDKQKSFPLGTVRLLSLKKSSSIAYLEYLNKYARQINIFLSDCFNHKDFVQLISTGGNPRRLGKLRRNHFNKKDSTCIRLKELAFFKDMFHSLNEDEIQKIFHLRTDRSQVIGPATDILSTVILNCNFPIHKKLLLPKVGLIDGIFLELTKSL